MKYEIEFSADAERHLEAMTARDRTTVLDAIEKQLGFTPETPTKNRKLLRANPLAAWELRVGDFRVFYNVEAERVLVIVVAVGEKRHNIVYLGGKEYRL